MRVYRLFIFILEEKNKRYAVKVISEHTKNGGILIPSFLCLTFKMII